jgi:hypothetical protein
MFTRVTKLILVFGFFSFSLFYSHLVTAQELDSREYKLLLNPARFSDVVPNEDKPRSVKELGSLLQQVSQKLTGVGEEWKLKLKKQRVISFLDVRAENGKCVLRPNNYILRQRADIADDGTLSKPVLTLKYRNPDRLLVANKNILALDTKLEEPKFEEDIGAVAGSPTPSFRSVYSRSGKLTLDTSLSSNDQALETLFGSANIPSLKDGLIEEGVPVDEVKSLKLLVVNGRQVFERVFREKVEPIDTTNKISFVLTLWYEGANPEAGARPIVAEISFSFKKDTEQAFPPDLVRYSHNMFLGMQTELKQGGWLATASTTKTATIYADFCGCGS